MAKYFILNFIKNYDSTLSQEYSSGYIFKSGSKFEGHDIFPYSEIDNFLKKINSYPVLQKLPNNTKLYPTPFSEAPRFKIKDYCEKEGIKIKKHYNLNLVSTLMIDKLNTDEKLKNHSTEYYYSIPSDIFQKSFKPVYVTDIYHRKNSDVLLAGYVKLCDFILIQKQNIDNNWLKFAQTIIPGLTAEKFCNYFHASDKEKTFIRDISKSKKQFSIIDDQTIINGSSKDAIMDEERFTSIQELLKSNDPTHWGIAKEILANSNFEGVNEKYMYFVYNMYHEKLTHGKINVNVKNLLKRIPKSWKSNINTNEWAAFVIKFNEKYPNNTPMIKGFILEKLNGIMSGLIRDITLNDIL